MSGGVAVSRKSDLDRALEILRDYALERHPDLVPARVIIQLDAKEKRGAVVEEIRHPIPGTAVVVTATRSASSEGAFVPSPFQQSILDALDGKAMRTDALAGVVGDRSRLFRRPGGIQELRDHGMIDHHDRLGYYRPDVPDPRISGPEDLDQE